MTQANNSTSRTQFSLGKRMLVGAGIGLLVIIFFLLLEGEGDPAWGKLWMIRPLIIAPLAGATGGACNYFILHFHHRVGVNKIVAMILSAIVFLFGLWLGTILGFDGTLWD